MMKIAADIKCTFSSAITELKADILSLSEKLEGVENAGAKRDKAITRLERVADSHSAHLIEMNRQLEDLDNKGRRHNIRVRGIPESIEQGNIPSALQFVFNELLEHQTDTQIEFERAHRALRARPADAALPRDIICCLPNLKLKEEIMAKARHNEHITFNDTEITIF